MLHLKSNDDGNETASNKIKHFLKFSKLIHHMNNMVPDDLINQNCWDLRRGKEAD